MKKLISLIIFMLLFSPKSFAACDYLNRCPEVNSGISSQTSQFFSNVTGTTFFAEQFAQNLIKNELKKATGQNFDVVLSTFSVEDLLKGNFKSLTVSGNNVEIQGFHFSYIKLQTLCGFNSVDINTKPIRIRENAVLDFSLELSGEDLKNTIEYGNYSKELSKIDLSRIGISSFYVYPSTIRIENEMLYFTINATPKGPYKPMDIIIGADIKVENEKIISSRFNFINLYTGFDLTQFSDMLRALNNLNFPIYLANNKRVEIQIRNINISNDKALINGMIFIPKD